MLLSTTTCFPLMFLFSSISLYYNFFSLLSPPTSLTLSSSSYFLLASISSMATENKGKPLPKFGEWDVNNPASAEGFTVIFSKASDEKKTNKASGVGPSPHRNKNSDQNNHHDSQNPKAVKKSWFCFR